MSAIDNDTMVDFCGGQLPDRFKVVFEKVAAPEDEIAAHLTRLMVLHPKLSLGFRREDLSSLDGKTKLQLLADVNRLLGIAELSPKQPL